MDSAHGSLVQSIRKFNRFYTNIMGLLEQHLLHSQFSLAETRVLYEIGNTDHRTAKKLIEELKMDSGYLSRIIKRFEREMLLYRVQSSEDGRVYFLYLTDEGKETLAKLTEMSNHQIHEMINPLPDRDKLAVTESMKTIENTLSGKAMSSSGINIRHELRPGDVGYLIYLHGVLYARECGYNHMFEGYVCKTFYDFLESYSSEKDRLWVAEADGKIIGAIAIVAHSPVKAQLRWFILDSQYRGIGLGKTLLAKSLKFCKERGYKQIFLDTTEEQETAIYMYMKAGFKKVSETKNKAWGKELTEERYELIIE